MFKSWVRFCLTILLVCFLIVGWQARIWGQISLSEANNRNNLPPLEVIRYGSIEVTWVESPLNKQELFQIAAPTVIDRGNLEPNSLPVEIRARNIEALLWLTIRRIKGDLVTKIFRPELAHKTSVSARVIASTLNNRYVVQIKYGETSRPLTIATVTPTDVDFYSQNPEQIVEEWRDILQQKISEIEYLYSAEVIRHRIKQAIAILLLIIFISTVLSSVYWWLGRQQTKLQLQYEAGIEASKSATVKIQTEIAHDTSSKKTLTSTVNEINGLNIFGRQTYLQQSLGIYRSLRWLSVWLFILTWYGGIYAITTRLPILMRWSETILSQPLELLAIWFSVSLLLEISKTFIRRSIDAWKDNPYLSCGESQRKSLRLTTIATALKGFMTFVYVTLGIVLTLALFNISASSILAGGAVIGLAISFGTQNLVKDVVNGCLILLEDRFAVGDVIIINGMDGFVEEFNLRLTQLRNSEGQLITIPNSAIAEVRNLTRLWSRVDFTIEVAYENDPDLVLKILEAIAREMYQNPEWQAKILEFPEILGIESLSHTGMKVRVWFKTVPLQQWLVGREYRLRVRRAFEKHNIVIGRPQWVNYGAPLGERDNLSGSE